MTELLDTIELQTHESCDWSVIWMHGLGADVSDFAPVLPERGLDPSIRKRTIHGGRAILSRRTIDC